MWRYYNVHSTNTMAGKLLIDPLKHNCTFDVRSANYVASFYLLVMGKWGHLGTCLETY